MTKFLRLVFAIVIAFTTQFTAKSQSLSVNTTGNPANASAMLDVESNAKGVLIPRMTKAQKNAIPSPATGLLVFQNAPDSIGFYYYNGVTWLWLASADPNAGLYWHTNGDAGTDPTLNFLGTTDTRSLRFRYNSLLSGQLNDTSTLFGYKAGRNHPFLAHNIGIGPNALENNNSTYSIGIGDSALYGNTAGGVLGIGYRALSMNAGFDNTAIGYNVLDSNTGGSRNVGIGNWSLSRNKTGNYNVGVGFVSLSNNTGSFNTAIGDFALGNNTTGGSNTVVGSNALPSNTTGDANTSMGTNSMYYNKAGGWNTAIGYQSLLTNDSTFGNTAIGMYSMYSHKKNGNNTALGLESMEYDSAGALNTAAGWRALRNNKSGVENVALGTGALEANSTGSYNVAVGRSAGFYTDTVDFTTSVGHAAGVYNNRERTTSVGAYAGYSNSYSSTNLNEGSENTMIGYAAMTGNAFGSQNTALGYKAMATYEPGFYSGSIPMRNVGVGDSALYLLRGNDNVALGYRALSKSGAGNNQSVAVGSRALLNATTAYPNTAIGYSSQDSVTTGSANTSVGSFSLSANKTGGNNVAVGNAAMYQSTLGNNNTAVGNDAGRLIRSNQNTVVGASALRNDSTGTDNVAVGFQASYYNDTASQTTAIGRDALLYNKTDGMVGVGYRAGWMSGYPGYTAKEHVSVGFEAGLSNFTGNKITAVGYRAYANFNGATNQYWGNTTGRNTVLGDSAMAYAPGASNVAIGTEVLSRAFNASQNVAIGDSAMGNALSPTALVNDNVAVGFKSLSQVLNHGNTGVGAYSLTKLNNAVWNTAIGYHALETDTSGSENTVIGTSAFRTNINGIRNVSVGINTGFWVSSSNNTYLGSYAGQGIAGKSTGASNTAVGNFALSDIQSGNQNVAMGESALGSDSSGSFNVSLGAGSMDQRLRGNDNIGVGFWAGRLDTAATGSVYIGRESGYSNQRNYTVAIGSRALWNNSVGVTAPAEGTGNTAVGVEALLSNTRGQYNTAVGYLASQQNILGSYNTSVGYGALNTPNTSFNTAVGDRALAFATGSNNTAVGSNMMQSLTGSNNVGMGANALFNATAASNNVVAGLQAMFQNITGGNNTALGHQALYNSTANGNTALGFTAGAANTTGTDNTFIGNNADLSVGTFTNATAIGANAFAGQSNSMVLGSINGLNGATANVNVGIGTNTPDSSFSVADKFLVGNSGTIQFDNTVPVMSYMFKTGTANADRMVISHSTVASNWGLQYQDATDQFNFLGNGFNRMSIELGTGSVGLGVANPTHQLQLSTDDAAKLTTATWAITSDIRLKTVDGNYTKGLADILKLNTIMYHYAPGNALGLATDAQGYGFSAQEVQKVFPEAVKTDKNGYLSLNIHPILVSYINAFKEQQQQIEDLKKKNEQLEKDIQLIKAKLGIQ